MMPRNPSDTSSRSESHDTDSSGASSGTVPLPNRKAIMNDIRKTQAHIDDLRHRANACCAEANRLLEHVERRREELVEHLKAQFRRADTTGTGKLDIGEWVDLQRAHMRVENDPHARQARMVRKLALFQRLDTDQDGLIGEAEVVAHYLGKLHGS